jgi:uncharacterized protein
MAQIATEVTQSVNRFLAAAKLSKRVDMAYIYGSQARGQATEWSDIDVAVVSSDFSSDFFEERLTLMRLATETDDRIEPWPFTPGTFSSSDPLASEIMRTGVRVE